MKAKLKIMLPGFTGNMDDVVIYYNSHLNRYIARRKVIPPFTPSNAITQDIFAFRKRISVSLAYLDDCRQYIRLYNRKFRRQGRAMSTWPNVFMKIMRALTNQFPEIDLNTLSREQILEQNLPCKTVADAVDAGYLDKVPKYQNFTHVM